MSINELYQQNNIDNEGGVINSNRSNFDSKTLKKNLDKLSECSSLTRYIVYKK